METTCVEDTNVFFSLFPSYNGKSLFRFSPRILFLLKNPHCCTGFPKLGFSRDELSKNNGVTCVFAILSAIAL